MGVCVGVCGLVCVCVGGGGGQASIQSIQTINVMKWLTNKRKLPTRIALYSYYVKLLLKMFNVRFLVCLFCWNVVFLAGTFLGVSLTCTDGQLTDEMSIVSTSQHQLPFGQIVTVPTYIAHDGPTGNESLPLGTDQLYAI